MGRKQLVTGILGILIGFILGFFLSQYWEQSRSALEEERQTGAESPSQFPEDHPPAEIVEKLAALQERARANPQDHQIRVLLGNLYYDMGRFDGAITWYSEALGLDPNNVDVRTDLGTAYLYTGDTARALLMYQESLETRPNHPQTLQNMGFAYLSIQKLKDAIRVWQKLIEKHPEYPHVGEIEKEMDKARAQLKEPT